MRRQILPLLLAHVEPGDQEREPIDRLRMQKGVFLLCMRGPTAWRDLYDYEPYDWGPFSRDLAHDLEAMDWRGLLEYEKLPGRRYGRFRITEEGQKQIAGASLSTDERAFAERVRAFLTSRSFSELLRDVYAEFPEYAVNSRFKG